ncbi:FimV/HubP family polar landmark protein [Dokdonella soli]|uniref:FimV N-terminal domain-containing protein n=1 Tax=Dokdonella soli TaxID=529810 RepID=A0ABP3U2B1_9GAMM
MKRPLQLPLAIALALGGTNALALGLGPVHVKSKLNQPLDAEIPVIQGTAGEAEGLLVNLAGAEDFERIGLNRSRLGVPLEFAVVKGAQGDLVIKVTSKEAVREPYLDFLVEANWPKGRLLREYTVLLDPPVSAPGTRSASTSPLPATPATASIPKPEKKPAEHPTAAATPTPAPVPRASAKPARETPAHNAKEGEYGPVEAGETLSEVARASRPNEGVNINQMMLALLKNNPNAFYKDNINALKRGAILRVPSADEIKAVGSASEAAAQVHSQVEDWRGGRASPTLVADTGSKAPASAPAAPAKAPKAVASDGKTSGERLELVPPKAGKDSLAMADRPGAGAGSAAATTELKSELARAKEALTTQQQAAGELKSRVKELEDLKGKNDRLISLKDSEIAELQQKLKQLQEKSGAPTAKPASPPSAPAPAPAPAAATATASAPAPVASVPATTHPTPAAAPSASTPAAAGAAAAAAAAANAKIGKQDIWGNTADKAATTKPAEAGKPVSPAPAVTANGATPVAASPAPAGTTVTTTPLTPTPPTTTNPAPAPAHATSEAPKPAASAPATAVSKPKPQPLPATAPWYEQVWVKSAALAAGILLLLFGLLGLRKRKPATAVARGSLADSFGDSTGGASDAAHASMESEAASLHEQLQHEPSNVGLHLELLSLYYAERNVAQFEDAATEMHAYVTDPHQPEWLEAQAMGQELAPHNPLFAGAAHYDDSDAAIAVGYADTVERPAFEHRGGSYAHNHEEPVVQQPEHPEPAVGFGFNHDDMTHAAPTAPARAAEGFDFDDLPPLDFEQPVAPVEHVEHDHAAAAPAAHLDEEFFAGDDAIGTKLDLAKAYMDMGDPEGARSMLEEVIAEGNEAQKAEAHRLMAEIR